MKYAIFVDVDGTLLDNKQQIPESAIYAIKMRVRMVIMFS